MITVLINVLLNLLEVIYHCEVIMAFVTIHFYINLCFVKI